MSYRNDMQNDFAIAFCMKNLILLLVIKYDSFIFYTLIIMKKTTATQTRKIEGNSIFIFQSYDKKEISPKDLTETSKTVEFWSEYKLAGDKEITPEIAQAFEDAFSMEQVPYYVIKPLLDNKTLVSVREQKQKAKDKLNFLLTV